MNKVTRYVLLAAVGLSINFTASAQSTLNEGSISTQFDYLNEISNNYQEFKVVKKTHLEQLKKNVTDSLRTYAEEQKQLAEKISRQESEIKSLQEDQEKLQAELSEAIANRENLTLLGIQTSKTVYNSILWTIIAGLTGAFAFSFIQFSRSHKIIKQARKDLADTMEEFEQHRKNTLDRERKLKRELVDALQGKK
ncbi:MAG: hypothetical protein ACXIT9_06115 [Nitritalea sp.]